MPPVSSLAELKSSPGTTAAAEAGDASMLDLLSLRAAYLRTGMVPEGVRPVVLDSWERCRAHGVDPNVMSPQQADPARLVAALADNHALVAAAHPLLEEVHEKMNGTPHIVALSDCKGYILRLHADAATASSSATQAANLFEGASWHERHIGCNGIGTCLAAEKPVVLIGPEHYQSAYVSWTCIGIPLRNGNGAIAGALDFSIPNVHVASETWGWVLAAARAIEANLSGRPSEPVPDPATPWGRSFASLCGVMELLVTQLKLPPTHARFVEDVQNATVAAVAEHERAQLRVHESEERFRLLAEAVPQLVWTADVHGTIDYCNSRVRSYIGLEPSSDGHWRWEAVLHPDDAAATRAAWEAAVTKGEPYEIQHRVCMADGSSRWHLSRAHASRTPDGRILKWFGTSTDIDEQKRAQELLEKNVQERTAMLRETIADLEYFSYTITHDMRAPLRAMQAFGQILQEEYSGNLDATGRDYLRRITDAAARMDSLIVDALDYTKAMRKELPLGPLDPGPLVRGIVESYAGLQPPRAQLEIAETFPPVLANKAGLLQCLSNLLDNAVKFVEPGNIPRVRIWGEERGKAVRLWVQDNGIGIAPEQHERVFVMFQRLSKKYDGNGIGLALVRKIVQRMHGSAGFESRAGHGSRFWVELARAPDHNAGFRG
jgi:PAS domain S-box-containing protein